MIIVGDTMKNKGFTLIELLAVIVILAVIALIAVPIILNVIETAKRGSKESSTYGYIDAVEKQISINMLDKNLENIEDGVYTSTDLKDNYSVKIKGESPTEGWVKIEDKKVVDYSLKVDEYIIEPNEKNEAKVTNRTTVREMPPETIHNYEMAASTAKYLAEIYIDPTNLKKRCSKEDAEKNVNSNTGLPTTIKKGCMKWYAYKEENDNYIAILDHNTTEKVAWNSDNVNTSMKEVATALTNDTTGWNSALNPRLITATEIAEITGNTTFNSSSTNNQGWFHFGSNNQSTSATSSIMYRWLYNYTKGCKDYACLIDDDSVNGYWTSTPIYNSSSEVWSIRSHGYLYHDEAGGSNSNAYLGVRPVITISKTLLK